MMTFLLSVLLATVLTSGLFTRPTQAELLNSVGQSVGCLLNIGTCPPPADTTDPPQDTTPSDPSDPGTTTPPSNTPNPDTTPPTAIVSVNPSLAGGNTQTVTISGTVSDETELDSYTLALNGNVLQQKTGLTDTTETISVPWNVSTPNVVPSGTYTITLDATDKAGNAATTATTTVEVDNDGPNVTVSGGDMIVKSGSISPDVEANDPNGVASYAWSADVHNPATIDFDASAQDPSFTPTVEGSYIYYVDVADSLGNVTEGTFQFSYAQDLATVPLPTTTDPSDGLVDNTPATPAVTPASTNATIRSGRDEITTSDDEGVLGSTVAAAASGQNPATNTVATISPTSKGWSIFGLLWYWWLIIIGLFFGGWIVVKKRFISRVSENS